MGYFDHIGQCTRNFAPFFHPAVEEQSFHNLGNSAYKIHDIKISYINILKVFRDANSQVEHARMKFKGPPPRTTTAPSG